MQRLTAFRLALAERLELPAPAPPPAPGPIDTIPRPTPLAGRRGGTTLEVATEPVGGSGAPVIRDVAGELRVRGFGEPLGVRVTATIRLVPALDVGADGVADAGGARLGGRDAARAGALFGDDARAAAAAAGARGRLEVADGQVGWRGWFPLPGDADAAADGIAHALRVHAAVEAARGAPEPRAGLEAVAAAFAAIPLPAGLARSGAPTGLVGAVGGARVAVWAPAPSRLQVRVDLPTALPGAPRVVREDRFGWTERLGAALGGRPELSLGDAAFDARFAVRSLRPEALAEALTADVRAAMLALDARLPATLGPESVEAAGPLDPAALPDVVAAAAALARALTAG